LPPGRHFHIYGVTSKMLRWLFGEKQEQKDRSSSTDDIEALRRSQLDLQERLLAIREKDIFSLRESVLTFGSRLTRLSVFSAVVVAVVAFLGVKQYRDIHELIENRFKQELDKSFGYYDKLMRARVLTNDGKYKLAESLYRDLWDTRPEDEIVFIALVDSLVRQQDAVAACQVVESAEKQAIFPRKCQMLLSFNNAGFAYLTRDIDEPSKLDKAFRLLRHAEDLGVRDNDPELAYALFNLAVYYFAVGDVENARSYATRWRKIDNSPWQEPLGEPWYQRLLRNRPELSGQIKDAFSQPGPPAATTTPSPTQSSGPKTTTS
jgi:tetratricopeptide (TPR) repeat protein